MARYVAEDAVFALLPFDLRRPAVTAKDGEGGITQGTWDYLITSVEAELSVRLTYSGADPALLRHPLVQQAANLLMAAQVCRKMKSYQETANSYFADANIKLKLFFEKVAKTPEGGLGSAESVMPSVIALTDTELARSKSHLSVFEGIKV